MPFGIGMLERSGMFKLGNNLRILLVIVVARFALGRLYSWLTVRLDMLKHSTLGKGMTYKMIRAYPY